MTRERRHIGGVALGAALLTLLALLTSCGSTVTITVSGTPTATAGPTNCGEIDQGLGGVSPANAGDLALCLLHAYQARHVASLVYVDAGIDSKTTHTFTVAPHPGTCPITDVSVFFLGATSAGGPQPPVTSQCAGMVASGGGVLVQGCGANGDITLP